MNNYLPDIKCVSSQLLHCNPIRYQTKFHDGSVNSSRIYCIVRKSRNFLRCYSWLRQWPELCKPKELLSEVEDNEAQEIAEKLLQRFEIQNDKIHCEFQALIPYVKRFLQLFPEIKEITSVLCCQIR